MGFLRRLFGLDRPQASASQGREQAVVVQSLGEQGREVTDRYYDNLGRVQAAMSRRDYEAAATEARESLKASP